MDIYIFMKLVGLIALIFLVLTFLFGFFKFKIKNRFLIHKIFGIITLILGIVHGIIVFYLTFLR